MNTNPESVPVREPDWVWSIDEYWSSSDPTRKVLVLSVGEAQIAGNRQHKDFIRTVAESQDLANLRFDLESAHGLLFDKEQALASAASEALAEAAAYYAMGPAHRTLFSGDVSRDLYRRARAKAQDLTATNQPEEATMKK